MRDLQRLPVLALLGIRSTTNHGEEAMKYAHIYRKGRQFTFGIYPTFQPKDAVASGVASSKKEAKIAISEWATKHKETVKNWNY